MPAQYRHRGMFRRGTQPALHPEPRISYFATVPQNAGGLKSLPRPIFLIFREVSGFQETRLINTTQRIRPV